MLNMKKIKISNIFIKIFLMKLQKLRKKLNFLIKKIINKNRNLYVGINQRKYNPAILKY